MSKTTALIKYVEWSWTKYLHDYYTKRGIDLIIAGSDLARDRAIIKHSEPQVVPALHWCNYIGKRLFKSVTFTVTYVPQYQREVSKMIRMIAAVSPGSSLEKFMRNRIFDKHLMGVILEFVSEYEPPAGAVPIDFWHQDMWEA